MVSIEIKSPHRLYKALMEVATADQKHKLVRAIIASRDIPTILQVLKAVANYKLEMSTTWIRHASWEVQHRGNAIECMECMILLPSTHWFKTRREPMLKKILRSSKKIWLYHPEPDSTYRPLTRFWKQKFTPAEVEMILERVMKMKSREDATHFLRVANLLPFPLTEQQRQVMEDLAKVHEKLPDQIAAG